MCVLLTCLFAFPAVGKERNRRKANSFETFPFDPTKFFAPFLEPPDKAASDAELAKISINKKEESDLGERDLENYKQQLATRKIKIRDRGPEVDYLAKLVAELQPQMRQAARYKSLHVYFSDDEEPQAYAFAGGHILVSQGMLKHAGSEAALVAVLGHELAHLDRGHLLRRVKQIKLAEKRLKAMDGFSPEMMARSFGTMMQLFRRPFGPAEELEADSDGIAWAYALGYDPQAIEHLYAVLDKPVPGGEFMATFFRTHPPSAERRDNLAATIAKLKADRPRDSLYLGKENLKRRIPKSDREFEE
jgi:predicted Zn-dependent protease